MEESIKRQQNPPAVKKNWSRSEEIHKVFEREPYLKNARA